MKLKNWIGLYICLFATTFANASPEPSYQECCHPCPVEYPPHHHHEHYHDHYYPPHPHGIHYHVTRSNYTFSSIFDMISDNRSLGSVVKSVFHVRTHYDLYDAFGAYQGQGIYRFFCLGLFYAWGTEIDIYDAQGNRVGYIDGQVVTTEPAKFSFYNSSGQRVAIAYLDHSCSGFSVLDPDNPSFVLARLTRNYVVDAIDTWEVNLYHPERISPQLIKVFATFACDKQEKFKMDR